MATLVSTTVTEAQTGSWPQYVTIVQEFDHPVIVTDDFALIWYTQNSSQPNVQAQVVSKPIQYVPTQLSYTFQVSPFADGALGVLTVLGGIQDVYGGTVDLKIGEDFSVYNTNLRPYFSSPFVVTDDATWPDPTLLPTTATCPQNIPPAVRIHCGPWNSSMNIPEGMWQEGNFYYWLNYTFKPDIDGTPFVWEPPFFYAYSGFGFPLNQTDTVFTPPFPFPQTSILYNITSSGPASQGEWDTCGGWLQLYPRWQGRVQIWAFGNDVFADGVVPWQFPAIADPTGDLTPFAIANFPVDSQLQFYIEHPFSYTNP